MSHIDLPEAKQRNSANLRLGTIVIGQKIENHDSINQDSLEKLENAVKKGVFQNDLVISHEEE